MIADNTICLNCVYCHVQSSDPGYSEMTPGSDFSMDCYKGHWAFEGDSEDNESLRRKLLTSLNCKDFAGRKLRS